MSLNKEDFPPLLGQGIHSMSMEELGALCVAPFRRSERRPLIFSGLQAFFDLLVNSKITGTAWVDGSFLTYKPEPDDCDLVLVMDGPKIEVDHAVKIAVNRYFKEGKDWVKQKFHCDAYVTYHFPVIHPLHVTFQQNCEYWRNHFGHDRAGTAKGIAGLKLTVPT